MLLQEPADAEDSNVGDVWNYKCPLKAGSPCVLAEKTGSELDFYSLDPAQGKGRRLGKMVVRPLFGWDWDVSPDGSRLALVGKLNRDGQLEVLAFPDGTWHEISPNPPIGLPEFIAWAADGKGLFVTSWNNASNRLQYLTLDGKAQVLIGKDGYHVGEAQRALPSPDGKHLAYEAVTTDSNVWMIEGF
jgi:hypothetical protein